MPKYLLAADEKPLPETFSPNILIIYVKLSSKFSNLGLLSSDNPLDKIPILSPGSSLLTIWINGDSLLWVLYTEAKAIYMNAEREKEDVLFEELRDDQEFKDYYDLVNSPEQSSLW